jgi:hypothetical protein
MLAQLGLLLTFQFVGESPESAIGVPSPGALLINAFLTALVVPPTVRRLGLP